MDRHNNGWTDQRSDGGLCNCVHATDKRETLRAVRQNQWLNRNEMDGRIDEIGEGLKGREIEGKSMRAYGRMDG